MNKLKVVGLGPGNPDYITPVAIKALKDSDVIIGGKRNLETISILESLDVSGKELIEITKKLNEVTNFITNHIWIKEISIVASGDPGFYGILTTLKKTFNNNQLEVIPGISSMQYMFSKLTIPWQNAYLGSIHGREDDILRHVKENKTSVFLTDLKRSYKFIAQILTDNNMGDKIVHTGNRLSYSDEKIHSMKAKELIDKKINAELCVVVIENE